MRQEVKESWPLAVVAVAILLLTVLAPSCCTSPELQKQAQLSEGRVAAFVKLMDAGETDRPTEQAFIRACGSMFSAMREAVGAEPLGGTHE